MARQQPCRVFVSHNSGDKGFVRKLVAALEDQGIRCWMDEMQIRDGELVVAAISTAMEEIDLVVTVLSRRALESNWVRRELDWALDREIRERRTRVIPVVIDGCKIPAILARKVVADFADPDLFGQQLGELVLSIRGHVQSPGAPRRKPLFGDRISTGHRSSNWPLALCLFLIGFSLTLVAGTYLSSAATDVPLPRSLKSHIYAFCSFMVAAMLGELCRIGLLRTQISFDPFLAQDAGDLPISSLFFLGYRQFVKRHWDKLIVKAVVLIEIIEWVLILVLLRYGVLIAGFLP